MWAPPVFSCACAPRAYWRVLEIHATFSSPVSRPSPTSGISIPTPVPPNPPPVLPVLKRTIMSPVNADLRAGDPEVRPAFGRCVLSLNSGMAALDDQFAGKVLMVTINGDRPPVSLDDLVKALGIAHGIQISDLLVEVCPPPADFFVRFRTTFDCSRVFESSRRLFCDGALVSFDRWHPGWGSVPSELEFLTKLTFHGMPRRAWNSESMNELINDLGGELVSMFVPPDSWALTVMAWMKKPSTIPKVIGVEIPVQEPGLYYSSPPRPSRTTLGMYLYRVFVHVEEVVNPSIEVLPPPLVPGSVDDVHYRSQRQTFPVLLGTMDGTGPTPSRGGGHCFFGRRGRAGCLDVL